MSVREDLVTEDWVAEIARKGLVPDPFNVGEYITATPLAGDNKIRFLYPSWVFHSDVVRRVLAGQYDRIMPYTAEFVPTLNCTFRCRIPCSFMAQKKKLGVWEANDFTNPSVHMPSVEFANELVDKLDAGGIKGITFTGGGEPSSFAGLEDVMEHAHGKGIDTVLFTNGYWPDRGRIDEVLATRPKLVRVSLNAGTESVHTAFHHPINDQPAFDTVIQSIERFARGSVASPETSVGLSVVINPRNVDDLVGVARCAKAIVERVGGGIAFLAFRPMFNNRPCQQEGEHYRKTNQLNRRVLEEARNVVEDEVRSILEGTGVSVSNVTSRYRALEEWESEEYARFYDSCRATGLFAELAPNGELHLCCDWNCDPRFSIGDLKTKSLEEIWQGDQRRNLLHDINSHHCQLCPPACKPHDANKQFAQVERLRHSGELYKVEAWIDDQVKAGRPKMANF